MEKVSVFGLGYVGLPLAVALAARHTVVGIDIDHQRVAELLRGHDRTGEVAPEQLHAASLACSTDPGAAAGCDIHIVTVPTPVTPALEPDLGPVMAATHAIGALLRPGAGTIVVYECTVYPGVTEELCGAELERVSGLVRGQDFFLGYSPERINPGDREHGISRIIKVVSAENDAVLGRLAALYGSVTEAGVFEAASIRVAEAAKVIENAQRDINIAFVNEVTRVFHAAGIRMHDVLAAARTKWNFLPFQPGLVGGHCIGVDPHYLAHFARRAGVPARLVLAGRETNDGMSHWLADLVHDALGRSARILVLGLAFKEDVPDLRNTKVADLAGRLAWLGHEVSVADPLVDAGEALSLHGQRLVADPLAPEQPERVADAACFDAVVLAVPHRRWRDAGPGALADVLAPGGLVVDLKGAWAGRGLEAAYDYRVL